jgi:molybdenum cofactor cytidylyltransferase
MTAAAGVLLAGGAARRFGGGKLLHPLPGGLPIGIAAWRNLRHALDRTVVVVRAGDEALAQLFRGEGAQVVVSQEAVQGMGHSLASGVSATADACGWVIALADMPNVAPQTIRAIAAAIEGGAPLALPVYRGERAHPVGFSARCRGELLALTGDSGARSVLQRYADEAVKLEVDDPGVLQDVDTIQDYEALGARRQTPGV